MPKFDENFKHIDVKKQNQTERTQTHKTVLRHSIINYLKSGIKRKILKAARGLTQCQQERKSTACKSIDTVKT